jgi:hypothetical protein
LSDGLANNVSLLVRGILQQLLAEIIAEWIWKTTSKKVRWVITKLLTSHKVCKVAEGLTENHITVFWDAFLQLLLQVPATMLIFAKTRDLSRQVLKTGASEAVN